MRNNRRAVVQPLYKVRVMGNNDMSETLGRYTFAAGKAQWIPQIDAGLMLRLGKLYVSGGARADYNLKNVYWKAGIGITF